MEIQNTLQGTKIFKKPLLQCFIYTINMKCYQATAFKKKGGEALLQQVFSSHLPGIHFRDEGIDFLRSWLWCSHRAQVCDLSFTCHPLRLQPVPRR